MIRRLLAGAALVAVAACNPLTIPSTSSTSSGGGERHMTCPHRPSSCYPVGPILGGTR